MSPLTKKVFDVIQDAEIDLAAAKAILTEADCADGRGNRVSIGRLARERLEKAAEKIQEALAASEADEFRPPSGTLHGVRIPEKELEPVDGGPGASRRPPKLAWLKPARARARA